MARKKRNMLWYRKSLPQDMVLRIYTLGKLRTEHYKFREAVGFRKNGRLLTEPRIRFIIPAYESPVFKGV